MATLDELSSDQSVPEVRSLVLSIRPGIARALGFSAELEDLLTLPGRYAWQLGVKALPKIPDRLGDWVEAELVAEKIRWTGLDLLAESIQHQPEPYWRELVPEQLLSNIPHFASRVASGLAYVNHRSSERLRTLWDELCCNHTQPSFLESATEQIRLITSMRNPDSIVTPAMVLPGYAGDLRNWLSS